MRRVSFMAGVAGLALAGALGGVSFVQLATAQNAPESLLPPGFDDPEPAPTPAPAPAPSVAPTTPAPPSSGGTVSNPVVQGAPTGGASGSLPPAPNVSSEELSRLPTLEELEALSVDELDDLLGLKPSYDIPPAARRSLAQVGVLSPAEGGLPTQALVKQPAALVRAVIGGTKGPFVSRWGHILMRRTMASRLAAPDGMRPADFAAMRAGVLNSMGEYAVARALVQDVDTGNWSSAMTSHALTSYIASSDLVGACPAVRFGGEDREDSRWVMMQAICNAYAGEGALASSQLNRAQSEDIAPEIDLLLAQRYAGAAGRGRGGTTVSWEGVEELTPWRFAIANAVGETVPEGLMSAALAGDNGAYYRLAAATAPMVPLADRAQYAQLAATRGVLSASAMVDLYSAVFDDNTISGAMTARASLLRDAYVSAGAGDRVGAMRALWSDSDLGYSGLVLTAYAAARIAPDATLGDEAGDLIASMLTAGLDKDAAAWANVVEPGSLGWALVSLSAPEGGAVSAGGVQAFISDDGSDDSRKSAFLIAGLAGLGRLPMQEASTLGDRVDADFSRQTRWSALIDRAAELNNPVLVAMLAGLGMQGNGWSQMTPLHLYHITSALRRTGMEAEARMIAAEAVVRG